MPKFVEGSLIFGILLAVLAFGGGEPVSFAIVELIFLAAAAALVVHGMAPVETFSWRTFTVPLALVGVVLLQLCPLPSSWVSRFANSEAPAGRPEGMAMGISARNCGARAMFARHDG